ncbi:MAG: DUF3368 domain-containing protein [Desulfatiglans sp.]|nr:DUF3368 domain-containing protein [Desulfatiglans sp.]
MLGKMVCNTGPLVALSLINRIDILRDLFDVIAVPEAVHREILAGGSENAGLSNYNRVQWIKVLPISTSIDPLLLKSLDEGEASVIALARELKADFTLIDERKARKIARTVYGLEVIGSARILVEAKNKGLIENVGSALQNMRDNGYWMGASIVEAALKMAGEL